MQWSPRHQKHKDAVIFISIILPVMLCVRQRRIFHNIEFNVRIAPFIGAIMRVSSLS